MNRIYHQTERAYDSGVRTAALAIILSTSPSIQEIRNFLISTINQTDHHMSTYVLDTMIDLANNKPSFRWEILRAVCSANLSYLPTLISIERLWCSYGLRVLGLFHKAPWWCWAILIVSQHKEIEAAVLLLERRSRIEHNKLEWLLTVGLCNNWRYSYFVEKSCC